MAYLDMNGVAQLYRVRAGNSSQLGISADDYPVKKPADSANLMLVVQGNQIWFFVNGLMMLHREDSSLSAGNLGLTLLSGTNKGFGTTCDMRNIELWILNK
jgi:hypothetical protein